MDNRYSVWLVGVELEHRGNSFIAGILLQSVTEAEIQSGV